MRQRPPEEKAQLDDEERGLNSQNGRESAYREDAGLLRGGRLPIYCSGVLQRGQS
jgi:hypothetical protein